MSLCLGEGGMVQRSEREIKKEKKRKKGKWESEKYKKSTLVHEIYV